MTQQRRHPHRALIALLPALIIFLTILLTIFPTMLPGAEPDTPESQTTAVKVKKGARTVVVKGGTRSWKDTDKRPLDQRPGPRTPKPILNLKAPRKLLKPSTTPDPAVQTSRGNMTMPAPITGSNGLNYSTAGVGWPPDTNGDAGLNYYVQAVNSSLGIFRKSDGTLVSATTFNDFFAGPAVAGTPSDNFNHGDPVVLFDPYAQRWFIMNFAWFGDHSGGSYFSIAASKTSDPTGDWWLYALNADPVLMNDFPKAGIWHDGIYLTANMFEFSGNYMGAGIWALKKPDIYEGTLVVQSVTDNSWYAWSILPSNARGTTPPPTTAPNYMYSFDADEWGVSPSDMLVTWQYAVDWDTPANTTWTGPTTFPVAAFAVRYPYIPQKDSARTLDPMGMRLMFSAPYRHFGTHQSVYLCHLANVNGIAAMRWYEVRINGGISTVYQQGTYAPDSHHRWMGSIAADKHGNIALGYSISSPTLFPSIRYAGRLVTDPAGQLAQGEAVIAQGTGSQEFVSRWGDYSMMTIDPTDDETFWYTQQYYTATGTDWQTRIASFKMPPLPPPVGSATDFNNDGKTDILLRHYGTGANKAVFMNGATVTGKAALPQRTDTHWTITGTGDFNNDGKTDILWRNNALGTNQVWFMDGTNHTGTADLKRVTDLNWKITGTGDFNNDGKTDILLRYHGTGGMVRVAFMDGTTVAGNAFLPPRTNLNWQIGGTGDFNSDGKTDILWRNNALGTNQVWFMDGISHTGTADLPAIPDTGWTFQGTGDFNSDGKPDIIMRHYGDGRNRIWYMDGTAHTGTADLKTLSDLNWRIAN